MRSAAYLLLLLVPACSAGAVKLFGTPPDTASGTDTGSSSLEDRVAALEDNVDALTGRVSALEGVVATDRDDIDQLRADLESADAEIAILQAASGGSDSGGVDTGATDSETIDALVAAVTDLQSNEAAAWWTTGSSAGEDASWQVLASNTLTITGDGPVVAWCDAAFSGSSGTLKLVMHTETTSYSSTAITGSSIAAGFDPSAGDWTLECQGEGGPWAMSTLIAVQVADDGR